MRDVDYTVRLAVYTKVAACNPRALKIIQRQTVMLCGMEEEHKAVKAVFENAILSKWLNVYDSDLMALLHSLKLDADEDDIKQTQYIFEGILKMYFK